jgi:hypothetical protein
VVEQTSVVEMSTEVINGSGEPGLTRDMLRANNRKLFWEDICSELIDNSLEHAGDSCHVDMIWETRKGPVFRVIDNGCGSTDIQAFFKPGKSVQTNRAYGNSTFGMGLYVCECCMSSPDKTGYLKVATLIGDGVTRVGFRIIDKTEDVQVYSFPESEESRRDYGIIGHGTNITFGGFAKSQPEPDDMTRIAKKLGKAYADAITSGALRITLRRNNESVDVVPESLPECVELKSHRLEIDGHAFSVIWGVTVDQCRDNGCRLVYGGKFFETSAEPCGDAMLGRFFASVSIPRTIGMESMDILKRTIDHPSIDKMFDELCELFGPELQASDELCRDSAYEQLTTDISSLLQCSLTGNHPEEGDSSKETRNSNGRDMTRKGVTPKHTGRRRGSRKGGKGDINNIPSRLLIQWIGLGEEKGLATYDHASFRLTFNMDCDLTRKLKESQSAIQLASIAATHIAKDIEGEDKQKRFGFSDNDFAYIYKTMMERIISNGN